MEEKLTVKEPEVISQLSNIEDRYLVLDKLVEELSTKLSSVCFEEVTGSLIAGLSSDTLKEARHSEIARRIQNHATNLDNVNRRIQYLIGSLEI